MKFSITPNISASRHIAAVRSSVFWTFAATEWHRLYRPYVPIKEGVLYSAVNITGGDAQGIIEHTAAYAHYVYEGIVYGPNRPIKQGGAITAWYSPTPTKHPTGRMMQFSGKASRHWDEAAAPVMKPKLVNAMQAYIDSGRLNLGGR